MPDGFESRSEGSDSTAEALESPCEGFDSRREDIESRREGTDTSRGLFIRNYRYKSMELPNGLNLAGNARRKLRQPPRRLKHLRRKCRGVPALPGFPGAEKAPVASAAEGGIAPDRLTRTRPARHARKSQVPCLPAREGGCYMLVRYPSRFSTPFPPPILWPDPPWQKSR